MRPEPHGNERGRASGDPLGATDGIQSRLNRYLVSSPMMPEFKKDGDGGLKLYAQNESLGADNESNWLPAPRGSFLMVMRLYWPKSETPEA
jgi:hypothetical protein